MQPQPNKLPRMPEIGYPESHYARRVRQAELAGDDHTREAYKVGQYVTLAMDPHLGWDQKYRYFRHALRRHTNAPPIPSDELWLFYQNLKDLIRRQAGQEALRLALKEDEVYAARLAQGVSRERIAAEAEQFFGKLIGHQPDACPELFNQEDWDQLKLVRNQWV